MPNKLLVTFNFDQLGVTYRAGDCFIMKPGYTGTWRTLETVRKVWVTA